MEFSQYFPERYGFTDLLKTLIQSWRKQWSMELPFFMVQLAPFGTWNGVKGDRFPLIRQAQHLVQSQTEKTWLISTLDAGDPIDIHPKEKQIPGIRLAEAALQELYDKQVREEKKICFQ